MDGGKQTCVVRPLFPIWDKDGTQEIPAVTCDLGGGPVELVCRYGLIRGRKETFLYYKGNMESSGVEIRCNGRWSSRGLFRRIWNGRVHPSRNHFLVQVDLRAKDGRLCPPPNQPKPGFWVATPGWRLCSPGSAAMCLCPPRRSRWKSGWCGCWHKIRR